MMDQRVEAALAVLKAHGIEPPELGLDMPDMPGLGRLRPNDVAVPVALEDIFGQGDIPLLDEEDREGDERLRDWIEDMRGALGERHG